MPRPTRRTPPARRPPPPRRVARSQSTGTEWTGVRRHLAGLRLERDPGSFDVVLWLAGDVVVHSQPVPAKAPITTLATALKTALASGRAAPPASIRVEDPALVPSVRAVAGRAVPVRVESAPEVDAMIDELMRYLRASEDAPGPTEVLQLARAHPDAMARFFASAAALYRLAPWTLLEDDADLLSVDAPALGWQGACVCAIGRAGEAYGVVCFASLDDYEAFREAAPSGPGREVAPGAGTEEEFFAVNFFAVADLPADVRQEVHARHWEIAGPSAFPILDVMRGGMEPVEVTARHLALAATLCDVLVSFFTQHGATLRQGPEVRMEGRYRVKLPKPAQVVVRHPHPDQEFEDFDEMDVPPALDTDEERATADFLGPGGMVFQHEHFAEVKAALEEMAFAILGRKPTREDGPQLDLLATSLVLVWSELWRPTKQGGRTGLDLAAADPRFARNVAARARLAAARVTFGEILHVDLAAGSIVVRDLFDGTRSVIVGAAEAQLRQYVRWMRVFGPVVPRADGRWSFPSVLLAAPSYERVAPEALLAEVNRTLHALGIRAAVDAKDAPRALLPYVGIAAGVLTRLERAVPRPTPRRVYMTNSDGERIEFHKVRVKIHAPVGEVARALVAAPDFWSADRQVWELVDRARTEYTSSGESMGQLAREGRTWVVRANSARRVERMLDRLGEILGERPVAGEQSVEQPWRTQAGVVAAAGEGVDTVVLASGPAEMAVAAEGTAAGGDAHAFLAAQYRRVLDRAVPAVGGVPRERVATLEGRTAVERWLRDLESRGIGSAEGAQYLDLDFLREELGLPKVI